MTPRYSGRGRHIAIVQNREPRCVIDLSSGNHAGSAGYPPTGINYGDADLSTSFWFAVPLAVSQFPTLMPGQ